MLSACPLGMSRFPRFPASVNNGLGRRLLRQCHERIALEPDAGGAPRPTPLEHARRAEQRDLRVPGDLSQLEATAFGSGDALPRGVRSSTGANDGSMIQLTRLRKNPKHRRASDKPGTVQCSRAQLWTGRFESSCGGHARNEALFGPRPIVHTSNLFTTSPKRSGMPHERPFGASSPS